MMAYGFQHGTLWGKVADAGLWLCRECGFSEAGKSPKGMYLSFLLTHPSCVLDKISRTEHHLSYSNRLRRGLVSWGEEAWIRVQILMGIGACLEGGRLDTAGGGEKRVACAGGSTSWTIVAFLYLGLAPSLRRKGQSESNFRGFGV